MASASTYVPTGNQQAREGDLVHGSEVCLGVGREATLPGRPWRQGVLHHQVRRPGSVSHPQLRLQAKASVQIQFSGNEFF